MSEPLLCRRRRISRRNRAEALRRAGLGAAEELLRGRRSGRDWVRNVGGEVGAARRAVSQPRRAGPRPAVVEVLTLEDFARGQVVPGKAVEPVKGKMII